MDVQTTRIVLFAYLPALRATVGQHSMVEAVESAIEHLAKIERLKRAEERDLFAIEQGLDRDDTLGAAMRRQREEIERLREALKGEESL